MILDDKPPLDELAHHGVKGMHWGVRSNRSAADKAASRQKFKRNAKIAGVAVGVGGAAIATYLITKHGNVPVSSIPKLGPKLTVTNKRGTSTYGEHAVKAFEQQVWKKQVSDIMKDMAEANHQQDQWMRSMGLGHIVNNGR